MGLPLDSQTLASTSTSAHCSRPLRKLLSRPSIVTCMLLEFPPLQPATRPWCRPSSSAWPTWAGPTCSLSVAASSLLRITSSSTEPELPPSLDLICLEALCLVCVEASQYLELSQRCI